MKILIVEDSARLRETLQRALERLGHAVDSASDGAEGDAMARHTQYDVAVLDRMMPGGDGLEVLRGWRKSGIEMPVLLLTALGEVGDRVQGLQSGADDYLAKPFALPELIARLEALVRRRYTQVDPVLKIGPLELDTGTKKIKRSGEEIALSAREYSLLEYLARRAGQVMSREQIEAHLYSELSGPLSNAVDAAVYSLRRKMSPRGEPPLIHTRRGLGYVLEK